MRVEEIKVMQYEELSDSAKESAKDWYRSVDTSYNWWDDALASIKAFADVFNVKIKNYEIGAYSPSWMDTDAEGENFRGWNKKSILAMKEDRTGYYLDGIIQDAFVSAFKDTGDAKLAFGYAIDKAVKHIQDDMEYQFSDEAVEEMLVINEYEFTEDGTRYH